MQRVRSGLTLNLIATTAIVTICLCTFGRPADAQTTAPAAAPAVAPATDTAAPATAAAPAAPAAPAAWMDTLKFSAQVEGGIVGYPAASKNDANPEGNGLNFGQLFTDRSNSFLLNQLLLTVARPLDPKATDYDFGFKLQGMYGTDARYTHYMGILDYVTTQRMQFDIVEANVSIHTPWLTDGGIDFKIGGFPTPLGYEVIDASVNPFYSHSYIFNFGLPFKQTGAYAVTHLSPNIDIYTGIDTGENTTIGPYNGDNNNAIAGMAGVNLTFLDGNLTALILSHFGPENPKRTVPAASNYGRYENDAVITWKATPALTFVTEGNWIHDDYFRADAYGAAQYASYTLNDQFTLNARAEVYRDQNNFFVGAYPNSLGPINSQLGFPATIITAAKATTYSEVTLGFTYKVPVPAPVSTLLLRPEVRYDYALNGTKPYNNGTASGAFTISADFVLGF
jgi:hypothetical protein